MANYVEGTLAVQLQSALTQEALAAAPMNSITATVNSCYQHFHYEQQQPTRSTDQIFKAFTTLMNTHPKAETLAYLMMCAKQFDNLLNIDALFNAGILFLGTDPAPYIVLVLTELEKHRPELGRLLRGYTATHPETLATLKDAFMGSKIYNPKGLKALLGDINVYELPKVLPKVGSPDFGKVPLSGKMYIAYMVHLLATEEHPEQEIHRMADHIVAMHVAVKQAHVDKYKVLESLHAIKEALSNKATPAGHVYKFIKEVLPNLMAEGQTIESIALVMHTLFLQEEKLKPEGEDNHSQL